MCPGFSAYLTEFDVDDRPRDRYVEDRPVGARDRQHDAAARRAAQPPHDIADIHADDRLSVGLDDAVAGLDAGAGGGRAVDRRDHLRHAVFHRYLDPDAAELTAGGRDQLAILALGHVVGMWVEPGQHAF